MSNNNNKCLILSAVCIRLRYRRCSVATNAAVIVVVAAVLLTVVCCTPVALSTIMWKSVKKWCIARIARIASRRYILFLAKAFIVVVDCQQQCSLYSFRQQQSICYQQLKYHTRKITNHIWRHTTEEALLLYVAATCCRRSRGCRTF